MPTTVKDAMFLTGWLGMKYFWCDRLCIIQDDGDIRMDQVKQMGEIYARAYCTIIAYDSLIAVSMAFPCSPVGYDFAVTDTGVKFGEQGAGPSKKKLSLYARSR
jgi:Heterokaryon incompatibility protein (HET)